MPQSISQQKTTNAYHLQTTEQYRLYIFLISKSYYWMLLIMRLKYGKDEHQKKKKKTSQQYLQWKAILGHLQKHQQPVLSWKS